MKIALIITAYLIMSFLFATLTGKAIAYGTGSDLENQ